MLAGTNYCWKTCWSTHPGTTMTTHSFKVNGRKQHFSFSFLERVFRGGGKWNLFKFIYFSKLCVIWFVVSIVELTSTMHKPTNSQSQLFLHLLQRPQNRRETLPSTSMSTSDSTRTSRRCCPFRKSLTAPLPRSCNLGASSWRRESWKRYQAQSSSQGVFGWNWHCCCCCCWSFLYIIALFSALEQTHCARMWVYI